MGAFSLETKIRNARLVSDFNSSSSSLLFCMSLAQTNVTYVCDVPRRGIGKQLTSLHCSAFTLLTSVAVDVLHRTKV